MTYSSAVSRVWGAGGTAMDCPPDSRSRSRRHIPPPSLLALAAVMSLLLASCAFREPEQRGGQAQGDRRFDIAVGIDPDTLDPIRTTTTTVANMLDYTVETLTRIDSEGKLHPHLAESWETSPDGRTITLRLRQGVKFHDGTPFDATAAKFNLDRLMDPKLTVPLRGSYQAIQRTEVVDDRTVRLRLRHPSLVLVNALSWTSSGMLSPASMDKSGNKRGLVVHPVGTGPYSFESYKKGDRMTVTKFADYWGEKPYYDTVVFRFVPEAASRESLLRAGQADLIILPPISDLNALQNDPNVKVVLAPSNRTIFVAIKTPKFKDPRVRQALNYAVNKQELISKLLFGAAEPMNAPMSSTLTGYCPTGSYDYDPARAKALLQQAGATNLRLSFGTPTGRYLQDKEVSDAIAGYLREVGVEARTETMDWSSYLGSINVAVARQRFDIHLLGWAPSVLDASIQMDQFESSQHPPAGLATSFYKNERVDRLVAQADREMNADRRQQLYCEASKIIWEESPWIFLWTQKFPIVHSSDVTGVSYLPNEKFSAIYARPAG